MSFILLLFDQGTTVNNNADCEMAPLHGAIGMCHHEVVQVRIHVGANGNVAHKSDEPSRVRRSGQ